MLLILFTVFIHSPLIYYILNTKIRNVPRICMSYLRRDHANLPSCSVTVLVYVLLKQAGDPFKQSERNSGTEMAQRSQHLLLLHLQFSSQHPESDSQLSVTPVPGDAVPSLTSASIRYTCVAQTYVQAKH